MNVDKKTQELILNIIKSFDSIVDLYIISNDQNNELIIDKLNKLNRFKALIIEMKSSKTINLSLNVSVKMDTSVPILYERLKIKLEEDLHNYKVLELKLNIVDSI